MAARILATARADVRGIFRHIAVRNPRAARRWVDRIEERFAKLAEMPGLGAARPEVQPDLHLLPVGNYLILYRQVGEDVEVTRVLHGARRWQDLL